MAACAPAPAPARWTVDLSGRRAVVTGAARGIGKAIAQQLAACGAHVVGMDINTTGLQTLQMELGGPARCSYVTVDLSKAAHVVRAADEAGAFDLLVHAAGIAKFEPVFETDASVFDLTFAINVRSGILLAREMGKRLSKAGKAGAIVNISSQSSKCALLDHLTYSTSKAAVDHMTHILAMELGRYNVRVNAVNPTVVLTELALKAWSKEGIAEMRKKIPLGRLAEPMDVANVVTFLLSDRAAMVNGATVPVDGGFIVSRL